MINDDWENIGIWELGIGIFECGEDCLEFFDGCCWIIGRSVKYFCGVGFL